LALWLPVAQAEQPALSAVPTRHAKGDVPPAADCPGRPAGQLAGSHQDSLRLHCFVEAGEDGMHLGVINQQLSIHRPTTTNAFLSVLAAYPFTGAARPRDVLQFLDFARGVCEGAHALQKRNALDILVNIPPRSVAFPRLSMPRVVYDLVKRILQPRLIGQGPYGLCGPATFTLLLAKTRPIDYARLAVDLTSRGEASINGLDIAPNAHVRGHAPQPPIEEGDWLIEASIRNADDALTQDLNLAQYGGTDTRDMFDWLKRSGYGTVACVPTMAMLNASATLKSWFGSWVLLNFHPDRPQFLDAFSNDNLTDPLGNLPLAARFCANGWKVLLMITEKLASTTGANDPIAARMQAVTQAYSAMNMVAPQNALDSARAAAIAQLVGDVRPNHWVLARRISFPGGQVRITRYSYGTKETTSPIDADIFYRIYGGFIAVNERDLFSASRDWNPGAT